MPITRRQLLGSIAAVSAFPGIDARSEPVSAATIATAATLAQLALSMMQQSGSEERRWKAGFLLWKEIAQGQRDLLASVVEVSRKLNDVVALIGKIPGEVGSFDFASKLVTLSHPITEVVNSEVVATAEYHKDKAAFLAHVEGIRGVTSQTTVPRAAAGAVSALSGIEAIVALERLPLPIAESETALRKAVRAIETAYRNVLDPGSEFRAFLREYDKRIAIANAELISHPLYAAIIPKSPEPIWKPEDFVPSRVSRKEYCWMLRLPNDGVSGRNEHRFRIRVERIDVHREPTRFARVAIEVYARPVHGGDHYFEIAHPPLEKWNVGVWSQEVTHTKSYDLIGQLTGAWTRIRRDGDPKVLDQCIASEFDASGYPAQLAAFNQLLANSATLIAGKSVLLALEDVCKTNLKRCMELQF